MMAHHLYILCLMLIDDNWLKKLSSTCAAALLVRQCNAHDMNVLGEAAASEPATHLDEAGARRDIHCADRDGPIQSVRPGPLW